MRFPPLVLALGACNLGLLVILGSHAIADAEPEVVPIVRTSAFELVDAQGHVRTRLMVEESGEVVLRLLDETGTIRVKIGAGSEGSGLVMLDDRTEPGIQMLARADDSVIRLANAAGASRTITPATE